jgi:hypothetical protein
MNCAKLLDVLPLYLSGELKGEESIDMQLHLSECEQCARAVQADCAMDCALRTAILEDVPDVSAIVNRVHHRIAGRRWNWTPQLIPVRMAALAAILIFSLLAFPLLYVRQAQRSMALAAASDHFSDLVMLRHPDWESTPEDVTRFMQQQFPREQNLLSSITPEGAFFEKVRLCKLRGMSYAHFVFRTGATETSVYLLSNSPGVTSNQVVHLRDSEHGLDVAGFSAAGLNGMVVGQQGSDSTMAIANRLSNTL